MEQTTMNHNVPARLGDYNVREIVSPVEFVNAVADVGLSEMIHVVPLGDSRHDGFALVRLVESVAEGNPENVRIATLFEDGSLFSVHNGEDRPSTVSLHADDADTVLTWVRALARERSAANVVASYWWNNNSKMIESHGLNQESLFLTYETETGITHRVGIDNVFDNYHGRMAKF